MCTNPQTIHIKSDSLHRHHMSEFVTVPCGKCRECLNKRKNQLSYRCYRQAIATPNVWFITLTYNDDTMPVARSVCRVCRETGEIEPVSVPYYNNAGKESFRSFDLIPRQEYDSSLMFEFSRRYHKFYNSHRKGKIVTLPHPFYWDKELLFGELDDEYDYFLRLTPSVSRYDVRIWIKNFRDRWSKANDGKRLEFSYSCCFEYGPRSFRPHAHILIFGLEDDLVKSLCKDWSDNLGFVYKEKVKAINEDGSSGYLNVSRYLAKYMSKGKSVECESACFGFAECPRLLNSMKLGCTMSQREVEYFRCYDLVGKYDPEFLCRGEFDFHDYMKVFYPRDESDGVMNRSDIKLLSKLHKYKPLTQSEIDLLIEEIPKRLMIHLTDKLSIRLPMYYINFVFGTYDPFSKKIEKYKIWYLVTESIRYKLSAELAKEFEEFCALYPGRSVDELVFEFDNKQKMALLEREKTAQASYIKCLSKSIF